MLFFVNKEKHQKENFLPRNYVFGVNMYVKGPSRLFRGGHSLSNVYRFLILSLKIYLDRRSISC